MKALVSVKRVVDYKATIRLTADGSAVDTANVKMSINPFDEIAVEEAIRLQEKGDVSEIIVVSIGSDACQETLRTALAMGADRAILVKTDEEIQPLAAAKILQKITDQEKAQIVILGKQAIDSDNNQVGQMLAGLMHWPQGTFASKVEKKDDRISVTREIDGGLETVSLKLPAVITTDLRLNEPRYIKLPNIMKAKKKPLDTIDIATLGVDTKPRYEVLSVAMPEKQRAKKMVNSAEALVEALKNEAQVL